MEPEDEAKKLLEEVGISSLPIIPRKICEQLGIGYFETPLKQIDGLLVIDDRSGMICVNSSIVENGRKNFTGAHELGHFCMDGLEANKFFCPRNVIGATSSNNSPIELRANEFAAELLMPKSIYQGLVDSYEPGWDSIRTLSSMSETSDLATIIRYLDLTDESCALLVCEKGKIAWFRRSKTFNLYINMESRYVAEDTPAFYALQGDLPSDAFESVKADRWVMGKQLNKYSEILEWALPINPYGQVFTLLYDEEGLGDEEGYEDSHDDDYKKGDDTWPWEPPTFHKSKRKR